MPSKQLKVFVTQRLPLNVESRLSTLFKTKLNHSDQVLNRSDLITALKSADVLVCTINDIIDTEILSTSGIKVRLIANYGSGFDHIDVKTAHKLGISVTNTPDAPASDTADLAMALILSLMRRIKEGTSAISSNGWSEWSPSDFLGTRIHGKKLGILGMGRVGTELARRAQAFGLTIYYHNRNPVHHGIEKELNATYQPSLKLMLSDIDILSIHCPYTNQTEKILDKQTLSLLKPSAFLINTARGELIDETVLEGILKAGKLAGAGLDVLDRRSKIKTSLHNLSNVILLPHMGSATKEARQEMGENIIYNIKIFEDGLTPPNLILPVMT